MKKSNISLTFLAALIISSAQAQNPLKDLKNFIDVQKNSSNDKSQLKSSSDGKSAAADNDLQQNSEKINTNVAGPTEKSCDSIKSNAAITAYVDALDQIEKINPNYKLNIEFDDNSMLSQWVNGKLNTGSRHNNQIILSKAHTWVNKCANELKDTKYLWIFTGVRYAAMDLHSRESLRRALQFAEKQSSPSVKTALDANGNITKVTEPSKSRVESVIPLFNSNSYGDFKLAAVYAIYFDGENAVNSIGQVVNKKMSAYLEKYKEYDTQNKQAQADQNKKDQETKARLEKISKGDLKVAKSCLEIHTATGAEDGWAVLVTPHKRLASGVAKIKSLTEKSGGNGVGIAFVDNVFLELRTSSNTIWFSKNSIEINSDAIIVGRYVENTFLKLTNGSSRQSPVLEVICMQPNQ